MNGAHRDFALQFDVQLIDLGGLQLLQPRLAERRLDVAAQQLGIALQRARINGASLADHLVAGLARRGVGRSRPSRAIHRSIHSATVIFVGSMWSPSSPDLISPRSSLRASVKLPWKVVENLSPLTM